MKQTKVTEKVIGGNHFYIRPFAAFTAANISGELAAVIGPVIGSLMPIFGDQNKESILDTEMDDALPAFSSSMSGLSGDKFERLMKKLLVDYNNISVEAEITEEKVKVMDYDIANEVFCGNVQDMYILCWEVVKINFSGFFKKIGGRFGSLREVAQTMMPD